MYNLLLALTRCMLLLFHPQTLACSPSSLALTRLLHGSPATEAEMAFHIKQMRASKMAHCLVANHSSAVAEEDDEDDENGANGGQVANGNDQ